MLEMTFRLEQKTKADGTLGSSKNWQEFSFGSLQMLVRVFLTLASTLVLGQGGELLRYLILIKQ